MKESVELISSSVVSHIIEPIVKDVVEYTPTEPHAPESQKPQIQRTHNLYTTASEASTLAQL